MSIQLSARSLTKQADNPWAQPHCSGKNAWSSAFMHRGYVIPTQAIKMAEDPEPGKRPAGFVDWQKNVALLEEGR